MRMDRSLDDGDEAKSSCPARRYVDDYSLDCR
jgi:hypothetical protein